MGGNGAGIKIVAAAWRRADDHADLLAFERGHCLGFVPGYGRTRERSGDKRHGEHPLSANLGDPARSDL
jgi:hypothetical protein